MGEGYGWFGLRKNSFFKTTGDRIFPLTYKAIVGQAFLCKIFFARNQAAGYFFSESLIPSIKSQMVGSYSPVYWVTNLAFSNLLLTGMHNISQNLLKLVPGSQMVRMTRTSERQAKIWHLPLPSQLFPWGSGPVSCPSMVKLYLKTDLQYFKSRKLFLKEALLKAKYDC